MYGANGNSLCTLLGICDQAGVECTETSIICGDSGGGTYNAPSPSLPPLPSPDVFTSSDSIPSCTSPANIHALAWCVGRVPPPAERALIQAAITRMLALGGVCATRAGTLQGLLEKDRIKLVVPVEYPYGGAAPQGGGDNSWIVLSFAWVTNFFDASHATSGEPYQRTLQQTLAHEADHLAGLAHTDSAGILTPNSLACDDLP